jgi:signal transduction histidine kinase
MAGVLISTRVAFNATMLVAFTIAATGFLQATGMITVNSYWKNFSWTWTDIAMITIIYFIVATVSWLSNREIEKSLDRARKSEAELKKERDTLEVRVEERTRELRQAEMERMSQAYHFIEFGRLAGGIFHDLMNPLTALSLNIERIADAPGTRTALSEDVTRARRAAAHMQELMASMRRHLNREKREETFSVRESIDDSIRMLTPYARTREVRLSFQTPPGEFLLYGDPTAFTQALTNLVSNAIQSYADGDSESDGNREVTVSLVDGPGITVRIRDQGSGISPEDLLNIFEPFFTTKGASHGIGLGLSLAKRIVEKDFGGTLTVESAVGKGSTFTVYLPQREP